MPGSIMPSPFVIASTFASFTAFRKGAKRENAHIHVMTADWAMRLSLNLNAAKIGV
ncbi:MAG: hypothetical protein H6882_09425 [Rhodobiaceae bacterium]|nr:hypothetical protein [Rhodobiaceae bacterium]